LSYEFAFTKGFKEELEGLSCEILPIVDRQVSSILENPYERNINRKRLKNKPHTFRARIGIHVRMLYRVLDQVIVFLHIGHRSKIYEESGHENCLNPKGNEELLNKIRGVGSLGTTPDSQILPDQVLVSDSPVEIEELDWICEEELFLLQIPQEAWPVILEAKSVERLQCMDIDPVIKSRIEDYWTNPRQTQVEKLYTLSRDQNVETIAQRPLIEFLVLLDPSQREALQKIKNQGPYLIKGSAGTGKSLVGLYHVRDQVTARAGESLFDTENPRFGVITYTNTLVDANRALLRAITPASAHAGIDCTTLDKIAYKLTKEALKKTPNALDTTGISNFLQNHVAPAFPADSAEASLLQKLGPDYVAEEIEQAIIGNGLKELTEYLSLDRRGRKRALRREERESVWKLCCKLMKECEKRGVQTFEQWRLLALQHLRVDPDYPRYTTLFVDEAQDFSKIARQLCLELVADPKHLLLAADSGQSIYTMPLSWRKCDPRFDFQRRHPVMLSRSYRTTLQIGQAIYPLRADPGDEEEKSTDAQAVFSGPKPFWIDADLKDHPRIVAERIESLVRDQSNPVHAGQIAIIVRESKRSEQFFKDLKDRGIGCAVVDRGNPLKADRAQVHIITAHSSKGLGFPVVFVPEVSDEYYPPRHLLDKAKDREQREEIEETEQRLLYVALSRASHWLYMITDRQLSCRFLSKLDRDAHWNTA
jgi:superfamily I DNA/RNA helicase/mRNA-degrading endonuclease RelE of RelBE toxin-antitoxin system